MLLDIVRSEQDLGCITVSMLGYYSRVEPPGSSLKASTYSPSLELLDTTDQEEKLDKALSKLK